MEQKNNKQEQQKKKNLIYLKDLGLANNPDDNKMSNEYHNYNIFYKKLEEVFLNKNNCSYNQEKGEQAKDNVSNIFKFCIGNCKVDEEDIKNYAELTAGLLACGALDEIALTVTKMKVINMTYKMLDDKSDEAFKKIGQLVAFFDEENSPKICEIVEQLYELYDKNNKEGRELLECVISYITYIKSDPKKKHDQYKELLNGLGQMIAAFNENTNQEKVRNLVFGYLINKDEHNQENKLKEATQYTAAVKDNKDEHNQENKLKEAIQYIAAVKEAYARKKMNEKYMFSNDNGVNVFIKKFADKNNLSNNEINNLSIIYTKYYNNKKNKIKNSSIIYKKYYEDKITSSIDTLLKEGLLTAELSEDYVINLVKLHANSDEKAKASLIKLVEKVGHQKLEGIFKNNKFIDFLIEKPTRINLFLNIINDNFIIDDNLLININLQDFQKVLQYLEKNNHYINSKLDFVNILYKANNQAKFSNINNNININNIQSSTKINQSNIIVNETNIKEQIAALTSEQARKDAIMAAKTMNDIEAILNTRGVFWGKSSALAKFLQIQHNIKKELYQCSEEFQGAAKDTQASGYKKLRTFMRFFGVGRSKLGKNKPCFGLNRIIGTKTDARVH